MNGEVKVSFGPNVLYGVFDFPEEGETVRSYQYPDVIYGTVDFIITGGPIVTFNWSSDMGAHVDKVEPVEDAE